MRDGTFVRCDDMAAASESGPDVGESRFTRGRIQSCDLSDDITGSMLEELFNG